MRSSYYILGEIITEGTEMKLNYTCIDVAFLQRNKQERCVRSTDRAHRSCLFACKLLLLRGAEQAAHQEETTCCCCNCQHSSWNNQPVIEPFVFCHLILILIRNREFLH